MVQIVVFAHFLVYFHSNELSLELNALWSSDTKWRRAMYSSAPHATAPFSLPFWLVALSLLPVDTGVSWPEKGVLAWELFLVLISLIGTNATDDCWPYWLLEMLELIPVPVSAVRLIGDDAWRQLVAERRASGEKSIIILLWMSQNGLRSEWYEKQRAGPAIQQLRNPKKNAVLNCWYIWRLFRGTPSAYFFVVKNVFNLMT